MHGPLTDTLPIALQAHVTQYWQAICEQLTHAQQQILSGQGTDFWQALTRTLAGSDFAAEQCRRKPALLIDLLPDVQRRYPRRHYAQALQRRLEEVSSENALHQALRHFRQREMLRIIWRDQNRLASLVETTGDLSDLADACIDQALQWLYAQACSQNGTPMSRPREGEAATPQQLVVIGMGKLGARELNLSSDIDLIFAFPRSGDTEGARRCLDNQTFFNRLSQRLIAALDTTNADGFVFRVDMRLRPYGKSGILAPCFAAMEEYYQDQGREWERYAMIKARVVAGDQQRGAELMETLHPFVYRKYLDFSAFDSLRDMKAMINREVRRRNLDGNVKLGPGGIREVEFVAQAFQLIRGGRDSRLQQRELRHILPLLPETVGMPQQAVTELEQAYRFLRDSEHALQAVADQQTQELPQTPFEQARIAFVMGFDNWDGFYQALHAHRQRVRHHFEQVITPVDSEETPQQDSDDWDALWQGDMEGAALDDFLTKQGYVQANETAKLIDELRANRKVAVLQPVARERLDRLMPQLLQQCAGVEAPTRTLERVLQLIEAVLRRSAYLVLLVENPGALAQLVRLCSASSWFAQQLARRPILLDELIDVQSLYSPPDRSHLEDELRQQLLRIPEDDIEQLMESLRYFKHAHVLRVAAAEISGALPLMKVSDYLTYIAEVILHRVLEIAWRMLTDKHGRPLREPGVPCDPDFIIVGYGKMGGIELSYGSDLDLVFVHNADSQLSTDGEKSIPNPMFFTRLGQRIIHILNTLTHSGQLYDVDMRLRPSGNSGLLVSSLKAFEDYQRKEAWTWEHQALVRARVVAGCPRLQSDFETVRRRILEQPRERVKLAADVAEMRRKMRDHLGSKNKADDDNAVFNLKQDRGGIVDIEFLVQYFALAYGAQYPALLTFTDNIRILDAMEAAALLSAADAELLRDAYKSYRSVGHRLSLQEQSSVISDKEMREWRDAVAVVWDRVFSIAP